MLYLIVGDTYPFKEEIRSLGGEWRKKLKGWVVPNSEAIMVFMGEHPEFQMMTFRNIEEYRARAQEVADEKADKLLERAEKKRQKAAELQKPLNDKHGDIAFFTQPNIDSSAGRSFTRQRERMYEKYHKGFELENEAEELERRAESVRFVEIKGDAERRRAKRREEAFQRLPVGTKVTYFRNKDIYTVVKHNKKTVRIQEDSDPSTVFSVDPIYLQVVK